VAWVTVAIVLAAAFLAGLGWGLSLSAGWLFDNLDWIIPLALIAGAFYAVATLLIKIGVLEGW